MRADLEREEFIVLLERLKGEDDAEVLAAARDINAKMTVAGVTWDDVLISENGSASDLDDDDDDLDSDEAVEVDQDDDLTPLNDEEKQEVKDLIAAIRALEISDLTKEELDEYEADLAENELEAMDLRYLRALKARLSA